MVNRVNNLQESQEGGRNVCLLSAKIGASTSGNGQTLGGGGGGSNFRRKHFDFRQSLNTVDLYYFKQTLNGEIG